MRILVALSGGVDSSVAALLARDAGHEVAGAYMKNWINEDHIAGHCPWQEDLHDARAVANRLHIPFEVVNLMDLYRSRVVEPLLAGYRDGTTPNPDAWCNRDIKFGAFLAHAQAAGFDAIATGHYARRVDHADGTSDILTGLDPSKDQSYFLALLRQDQLRHALFPVGHLLKSDLRRLAAQAGLPTAAKPDSQGICFIGEVRMRDFLAAYLGEAPGPIVRASDGATLGTHRGLHFFTLGQRKGIGIPSNTDHRAYVVVGKRPDSRELLVAFDDATAPGLHASGCTIEGLTFVRLPPPPDLPLQARPRYRDTPGTVTLHRTGETSATVRFAKPQRALTPGQVLAIYAGDTLVGGGTVATVTHV